MNLVPVCLLFILFGYYMKGMLLCELNMKGSMFLLFLLSTTVILSQLNSRVILYNMHIGNVFLFLTTAITGSVFFIRISTLIKSNLVKWIGVMCLPIYVLQFHINQYSQAVEAILLDSLGCQDLTIKLTVQISLSLFICVILTNLIIKNKVLSLLFGAPKI